MIKINFAENINEFKNNWNSNILRIKIKELEEKDNYLAKNREKGLNLRGFRKRTIFSILGNITIKRRMYKDKAD